MIDFQILQEYLFKVFSEMCINKTIIKSQAKPQSCVNHSCTRKKKFSLSSSLCRIVSKKRNELFVRDAVTQFVFLETVVLLPLFRN